jgi:hypothetical protein
VGGANVHVKRYVKLDQKVSHKPSEPQQIIWWNLLLQMEDKHLGGIEEPSFCRPSLSHLKVNILKTKKELHKSWSFFAWPTN